MNSSAELRAALAGLAMQGILARLPHLAGAPAAAASVAKIAVEYADALLEELSIDHSEPTPFYVNQDR